MNIYVLTLNNTLSRIGNVNRKEKTMNGITLNVRALAANMKISIETLAERCGIEKNHLRQVSAGNVDMTAYDIKALSKVTGVPTDNIYVNGFDD